MRLLGLSGSLRAVSYNSALLRALPALVPHGVEFVVFADLGDLPLFNPDRENEQITAVSALKNEIALADGLVIATPEYAHGISGVMKNALDWLVSGEEFPGLPIALINTSPRAGHAQAALREVIKTMSGNIIEEASVAVPLLGSGLDTHGILNDREISGQLKNAMAVFVEEIASQNRTAQYP